MLWKKKPKKEAAAEDTVENDKKKVDNAKAVEMINRALKSLGGNTEKAAQCKSKRSKAEEVEVTQLR